MTEFHCETCGGNLNNGKCLKCPPKGLDPGPHTCRKCGRQFSCNMEYGMNCGPCVEGSEGPCCSIPPYVHSSCWNQTPWFEKWKRGDFQK